MKIDREEKLKKLHTLLRPVREPPRLYTINASGRSWIGFHSDPDLGPMFMGLYGVIILGLPIMPLRVFLVSNPRAERRILLWGTSYDLHGYLSLSGFGRVYGASTLIRLILSAYLRVATIIAFAVVVGVVLVELLDFLQLAARHLGY